MNGVEVHVLLANLEHLKRQQGIQTVHPVMPISTHYKPRRLVLHVEVVQRQRKALLHALARLGSNKKEIPALLVPLGQSSPKMAIHLVPAAMQTIIHH